MKKSMSAVLILAIFLVGGCLELGIEGKYVNTKHPGENYMVLNSDGTFFVYEEIRGNSSGTYEVKDGKIHLIYPYATEICKIEGNTILDPEGLVWKKV